MNDILSHDVLDRASGMLIGQACGDALGVPYQFATPPRYGETAVMRGGGLGPYEPGEWSDDTQLAICVARVASLLDLDPASAEGPVAANDIAYALEEWFAGGASDMSRQIAAVLRNAQRLTGGPADRLRAASRELQVIPGLSAGNGALMRTGVVGIANLGKRDATARAARAVAELTHADPVSADACVLWSEAVRIAVAEHRLDVAAGLDLIPQSRQVDWLGWVHDAERTRPSTGLRANGFAVTALQAAWHAINVTAPRSGAHAQDHVYSALQAVVRIGGDTDTTGAIAGELLGAYHGAAAIPRDWILAVHGWPGLTARELGGLARSVVQRTADHANSPHCPLCGTIVKSSPRSCETLCSWCTQFVTDQHGRPVRLYNVTPDGGYTAKYDDGSPASTEVLSGRVWIDGREYCAEESRLGGIVVRPSH